MLVDEQMFEVFDPDGNGLIEHHTQLYDRYDYLESRCGGINAYRNE